MKFSLSVAGQRIIDEVNKGSNVVVSPMCIAIALNMAALGSNGETLKQFLHFLGAKDTKELTTMSRALMFLLAPPYRDVLLSPQPPPTNGLSAAPTSRPSLPLLPSHRFDSAPAAAPSSRNQRLSNEKPKGRSLANALWVDHGSSLKPSFVETTHTIFKPSQVKNVDFVNHAGKVKKEVNSWAEMETKGLIKGILSPTTQLSPPLCLANALNLKGAWKLPFEASNTRYGLFHLLSGETARVPFMTMRNEHHLFCSFNNIKLLRLPYQHDQSSYKNVSFSMYVLLPNAKDGLKDLVWYLDSELETRDPENFSLQSEELAQVRIPKIKFSHCFEARELVKAKGLTLPFDPKRADFSNMVEGRKICIGRIFHKALFELNEDQTEAAAVPRCDTGNGCGRGVIQRQKPSFVADHPFFFMIFEDRSKVIVFAGAVLNPLQGVKN